MQYCKLEDFVYLLVSQQKNNKHNIRTQICALSSSSNNYFFSGAAPVGACWREGVVAGQGVPSALWRRSGRRRTPSALRSFHWSLALFLSLSSASGADML